MRRGTSVEIVRVSALKTDPRVNRPLDKAWVASLVSNWDPRAQGIVVVSENGDGRYVILDGQHRVEALREMHVDDPRIEAQVYHDLTLAEEARLFVELNNDRAVRPFDKFAKLVTAGDPDATFIASVLKEFRLHLEMGQKANAVSAVVALQAILRQDRTGQLLRDAFSVVTQAWDEEQPARFTGEILRGVAHFFRLFPNADRNRLATKLAGAAGGPTGLLGQARTIKALYGGTVAASVGEHLRLLYNKGLVHKLGEAES